MEAKNCERGRGRGPRDGVEIIEEDEVEQLKGKVAELEQELQYQAAIYQIIRQKSSKDRSQAIRFGSSSLAKKYSTLERYGEGDQSN